MRTGGPQVTVGLPVYNSERYVAQSISTLLAQTFRDFRLVICDNASTDRTGDICREYAAADSRVSYFRNDHNIGLSGNFNRVFQLSSSPFFKWATADDYWAPELLEDAVRVLEADPTVGICYPRAIIVDSGGREQRRWDDDALHVMADDPAQRFIQVMTRIRLVHQHLGVLRSDLVRQTGLFARHTSADVGLVAEMALLGKIYRLPKYQIYRRFHEDSSSWATSNETHQARRFHATNVRRVPFNRLRFHWRFFQGLWRAPVGIQRKIRTSYFLLKRMYWDRTLRADLRREVDRFMPARWQGDPG